MQSALALLTLASGVRPALASEESRRLLFTLEFLNPYGHALGAQAFWCYLPLATDTQQLSVLQVSMPHQLSTDMWGHRVLALHFEGLPPHARKLVRVQLTLDIAVLAEGQKFQRQDWLAPERFIESDDAGVVSLATSLLRESETETVRAIYDWVQGSLNYAGYLADDLGAAQALRTLRGDCTEYASLVVALCRACGIPARLMGGYVQTASSIAPRAADYHNWAEVFLQGRWQLVDAQRGRWLPHPAEYTAFRIHRDRESNPVGLAHRFRVEGEMKASF